MTTRSRRRSIDVRYLTAFLVLAVLLGGGTHFLHAYQVRRNAKALLDQADRAEADKDMEKYASYLGRYVAFQRDDLDACARYALLSESRAKTLVEKYRAYLRMEDVLRRDPKADRVDVRRRAAELAIAMNRPADARVHIERLLELKPDDAELEDLLGRCEEMSKQFAKARAAYESSLKHDPTRAHTAYQLARLLRSPLNPAPDLDKAADADKVLNAMVEALPNSVEARMMRCRYMQSIGNLEAAEKDLTYTREKLAPKDVEVLLASAELAEARRKFEDARKILDDGHKLFPDDPRFSMKLARLELRAGSEFKPQAVKQLESALIAAKDNPDLLWTIADLFIDAGDNAQARKLVDQLSTTNVPSAALDFLRARLLAGEGKIGEAIDSMERCRAGGTAREGMAFLNRKMNLLLGSWYEEIGNPDQQLAAFERVLNDDPLGVRARAGKAAALAKLGRSDDALALYRTLFDDLPALRLNAARLLMARDLRLPSEQRNTTEAEKILQGAPPELRNRPEFRLLLIDLLAVSGRYDAARTEAETGCKQSPKEIRYWLARAALADRGPHADRAKAESLIDEAEKQLGDKPELRLARVTRVAEKPLAEARPGLQKLEANLEAFKPAEQARIAGGLASAYARLGDNKEALRLMGKAVAAAPADLAYRQQYFDVAMLAGDDGAAAKQVEELRRIEGDEGVLWRYEDAARRVQAAYKGDTSGLRDARQELVEVGNRRPNWSRRLVLEGEIAEIEGRTDLALENYLKAIDRGERSKRVIRRTVQFLANRRRTEEARHLLQKVLEQSPDGAGDLNRMLVEVSIQDGDSKKQSLDMVRAAVSPQSKEYRDFLWLGQVLSSLGEKKEAEAAIRKALSMRQSAPEPWIALVVLLAESGRKEEARAELARAQHALPETLHPMVLGPCREALGEAQGAEAIYLDMLKARPNDPATKRVVAAYYLRTSQTAKADPYLRSLSSGDGAEASWARRTLALALAVTGDYQKTREALELLDKNLASLWSGPEDQRARAMVLALRPGDRRASIQALEDSFVRVKPLPSEEFLLAQLYDADRNWTKANEKLLSLVASKQGATPEILSYYVKALLRHNDAGNARIWLAKLEEVEPDSARTVHLKARLLKEENKGEEAGKLLTEFARKEFAAKKDPDALSRIAGLLADLGREKEAEELFRLCAAETEKTRPESVLVLATFLARRNHPGEALDLCDRVAARCAPELVASIAVGCLRLSEATDADRKRVQAWLDGEVRKKPDSVGLKVAQADLLDASGDYAGSERVYRDLLEHNPRNVLALNNLAWLLAVHDKKGDEALALISRAIEVAGPIGDLLDTRGTVYLAVGQPEEAVKTLEEAVLQTPTAQRYFHLTQAFEKTGKREAAKESWIKATKEMLLNEKTLHPLERADYQRFSADLAPAT